MSNWATNILIVDSGGTSNYVDFCVLSEVVMRVQRGDLGVYGGVESTFRPSESQILIDRLVFMLLPVYPAA